MLKQGWWSVDSRNLVDACWSSLYRLYDKKSGRFFRRNLTKQLKVKALDEH